MTWADIAGKDFRDAIRSPWVKILSVIYSIAFALWIAALFLGVIQPSVLSLTAEVTAQFISEFRTVSGWIVPGIAIVMAYASITDERDSGSMKVLLALPHSRRDLVLGKVIGRSGVAIVPIMVGLVVAAILLFVFGSQFVIFDFLFFSSMTLFLGIVFTAMSVGLSAFMGSNRRAIFASAGMFVVFVLAWNNLLGGSVALFRWVLRAGFDAPLTTKQVFDLEQFIKLLNPIGAYKDVVGIQVLGGGIVRQFYATNNYGQPPFYLTHKFSILVMVFWAVFPTALGVWHLDRTDL
jgi:ABC-2 type transport system permease protein